MNQSLSIRLSFATLLFCAYLLSFSEANAQDADSTDLPPISTYRPSISIGSGVVPKGTLQIEMGVRFNRDTPGDTEITGHAYPNLLLRVGILKQLELQVSGVVQDSIIRGMQGRRKVQGVGPFGVGLAMHVLDESSTLPSVALNGSLTLPVGDEDLTPTHAEPSITLAASKGIYKQAGILINAGYRWSGGNPISLLVLNLNSSLSQSFSAYLEAARNQPKGQQAAYIANVGLMWKLRPNIQFDVAAGRQLNSLATDYFFATGFSVRLPQ